jgi:hypothetical protein
MRSTLFSEITSKCPLIQFTILSAQPNHKLTCIFFQAPCQDQRVNVLLNCSKAVSDGRRDQSNEVYHKCTKSIANSLERGRLECIELGSMKDLWLQVLMIFSGCDLYYILHYITLDGLESKGLLMNMFSPLRSHILFPIPAPFLNDNVTVSILFS